MGMNFEKSDQYRKKIHDLIPGGAHTYSKGDDQFPLLSPAAIKRGEGAYLWDLDDNKFLDCSMGLTSVSLGHAYPAVVEKVREELYRGVNFQRPSYIEMEIAEKFLDVVDYHDMIKFAKNGSSVTTAAVKLARAYTGRKYLAFPSDHPFYSYDDWFIGKTLCDKGVPEEGASMSLTFLSSDLRTLDQLFERYPGQIACVITEPERPGTLGRDYLLSLQAACRKNGALLIVDEMITGYKTAFPGSAKKLGIVPDLATWGKGIANGFSFCALTGKKEIMEIGGIRQEGKEKVFLISSTHGGETHAIAAAIATLEEFQKRDVVTHNHQIGNYFLSECQKAISSKKLNGLVVLENCPWMPLFTFKGIDGQPSAGLRTLAMQEMISRGVLFQGTFVPCYSHQKRDVDLFVQAFEQSLEIYLKALEEGYKKFLVGPETKPVFRKYL